MPQRNNQTHFWVRSELVTYHWLCERLELQSRIQMVQYYLLIEGMRSGECVHLVTLCDLCKNYGGMREVSITEAL